MQMIDRMSDLRLDFHHKFRIGTNCEKDRRLFLHKITYSYLMIKFHFKHPVNKIPGNSTLHNIYNSDKFNMQYNWKQKTIMQLNFMHHT